MENGPARYIAPRARPVSAPPGFGPARGSFSGFDFGFGSAVDSDPASASASDEDSGSDSESSCVTGTTPAVARGFDFDFGPASGFGPGFARCYTSGSGPCSYSPSTSTRTMAVATSPRNPAAASASPWDPDPASLFDRRAPVPAAVSSLHSPLSSSRSGPSSRSDLPFRMIPVPLAELAAEMARSAGTAIREVETTPRPLGLRELAAAQSAELARLNAEMLRFTRRAETAPRSLGPREMASPATKSMRLPELAAEFNATKRAELAKHNAGILHSAGGPAARGAETTSRPLGSREVTLPATKRAKHAKLAAESFATKRAERAKLNAETLRSAGGPATRQMDTTSRPHHDPFLAQVQEVMEAEMKLAEGKREATLAEETTKWYWEMRKNKEKKEREAILAEEKRWVKGVEEKLVEAKLVEMMKEEEMSLREATRKQSEAEEMRKKRVEDAKLPEAESALAKLAGDILADEQRMRCELGEHSREETVAVPGNGTWVSRGAESDWVVVDAGVDKDWESV